MSNATNLQEIIDPETILESYLDDFEVYAGDCLSVRDHNTARIVPLRLNLGQRLLHQIAEEQKKETGIVRIVLLKSRRFGGSTYVEGRFYRHSSLNFNRNTFIVGHEEDSTSTLFRMAKLYQERNPIAPETLASNAQELRFDNKQGTGLKSEYRLATARNVDAGRSQGIHYLHVSEEAFWPGGAGDLLDGLFQCIPDPPAESEVFRESTANGYGNTFQQVVFDAYAEGRYPYHEHEGINVAWSNPQVSDWILVFIPWFLVERYSMAFESEEKRQAFERALADKVFDKDRLMWVESEAARLKIQHGLTLEQLHWREWAIKNKCRGSVNKFHQEYPSSVDEAFLTQGSNVFGKEMCDDLETQCRPPKLIGDLRRLEGKVRIRRNQHGAFSLWEAPEKDEQYFMTIDTAGGQKLSETERKKTDREPDRTCIDLWRRRDGAQCCQWNGHVAYDLIADVAEMIGDLYGRPEAACELQNHGFTVVADFKRKNYPQWEHKPGQPGWQADSKTKPESVDSLYQAARDGALKIHCRETVQEMRTFIEDPPGQFNAASGCKDDRVTTARIASQLMHLVPHKAARGEEGKGFTFKNWSQQGKAQEKTGYREVYVS